MVSAYVFVFVAGLVTALATGLGAVPFFFYEDVSDANQVLLWGVASGIMVAASVYGLFMEGVRDGSVFAVASGAVFGAVLVYVMHHVLDLVDVHPKELPEADVKKLLLILGVLTVHSFPEGVAVGVSFADLNLVGGIDVFGFAVPVLAVFMTVTISIHNIPEGVAVSIPLRNLGVERWKLVWWSVFSSLPQPVGAVIAYGFVRFAREFLPYGFGFAGGAMIYLVVREFIPEALDTGRGLERRGVPQLVTGFVLGVVGMTPFLFL